MGGPLQTKLPVVLLHGRIYMNILRQGRLFVQVSFKILIWEANDFLPNGPCQMSNIQPCLSSMYKCSYMGRYLDFPPSGPLLGDRRS